jgi:thiol-disulfide isomerase/thioredoxin
MSRFSLRVSGAVILFGSLAATMPSRGDDRSPDAILKEIDSITVPVLDESRAGDRAYNKRFDKEHGEATNRRAPLIGALYRSDPENPKLATLLPERWEALAGMIESPEDKKPAQELTAELNEVIARTKHDGLKKDAVYWKAKVASSAAKDMTAKIKAVDEFIALDPKDERGAELLFDLGFIALFDDEPAVQRDLYARVAKEYPERGWAETARGKARQFDALGMPLDLEFTDAISGAEISMKGLKGKVVLIHFWATDADPEISTLKKLHAEYKNKGVEFIGVSLDPKEGGLETLKAYVAKEGISWPQYFQGDGVESKFSLSWGIDMIPTDFLVDQQGRLFSVELDGDILETMIPELLNRPVPQAGGNGRSAAANLEEIDALRMPAFDNSRREDEAYVKRFYEERREATNHKAALIGALYRADPGNPELATLLPERWEALAGIVRVRNYARTVAWHLIAELNEVIATAKSDGMKKDAAYWKAQVVSFPRFVKASAPKWKAIDEFIALDPKDERGAELLFELSDSLEDEPAELKALYTRIAREYPDSDWGRLSEGSLRRLDTVGKPFDLEFTDVISGAEISMKGLKGKVVVIDFWATWCGPCVAEMPTLKKLYAEYKDKGVEFIGVSLDEKEGGLEKLKAFVTKEGISWPQYFQGDGFESKFSTSWGINAIPAVFVVDQEGKLVSIEARGQLETMIPDLLDRRFSKPGGDGGR